jgi:hypothetical protein
MPKKSPATDTAPIATAAATEAPLNMITMTDGRIVEFTGKRKLLKEAVTDEKGIGVRLDFVNGQTRMFYLSVEMIERFAIHGAEQKLGDEIAGVDDIEDCVLAVDDLIDRLYNLEWSAKRDASAMAGASILAKALVQTSGKTIDEVRAFLAPLSQAQKVALRQNAAIAPVVAELEALKASKKKPGKVIDTDSLLGDLAAGIVQAPVSTEPVAGEAPAKTAEAAGEVA